MTKRLNKLITENEQYFNKWIDSLNKLVTYNYSLVNEGDIINAKNLEYEIVDIFNKVIQIAINYNSFKDKFDTSKMYLNSYSPELIIVSKKTQTNYYMGMNENGIYIRTYLYNTENLKNMDDDFWMSVLKLKQYKGFSHSESESYSKEVKQKYPDLFRTYKGTIFLMFRKFFIHTIENREYGADLGDFRVNWDNSIPFSKMIEDMCNVFKILYKLNYSLWKITDLKNKKNNFKVHN